MATDFKSDDIVEKYAEGLIAEELSLKPIILESLGEVKGKTVIDLGCGDGKYCIVFASSSDCRILNWRIYWI